ncbi:Protein AIG2, putative [Ricinus communis]|uniref:Putative gamma-glutamylcyclotransferase n=1 Tax=Ricinus communis TaxID=3988 RepID=B9SPS5_RICCO|nr:Protein AIG2, putative [Ricinus communis]|eukprot:XP_002527994.1 AIG2-like protein D [Ricinus communis]
MSCSSELHRVFVYGSLLEEDIVRVLLKRVPRSSPAVLHGFHRFSIKGRVYPAILPVSNNSSHVAGKVLFGISDPELRILDIFEDVEYQRTTVDVSLMDGGRSSSQILQAHTYVWENKTDPDLFGEWDFEEWKKAHMNDFLKMSIGFMEELELPESKPRVATYQAFFHQDEDLNNSLHP